VSLFDLIVVQPMFNALMALYSLIPGGDFGIAVILFTIIIRILMWPLIKKQLHQVKAMRKLQPELVTIKKKAKGNKQLEGMMMLELYKKHNVNPFRTIGILLIQLPIFIGLYHVIQIFTAHRDELAKFSYWFMEQLQPVANLIANPDTFNQYLFGIVDITKHAINFSTGEISPFLIFLAVAAGLLQYISSKQTMPQQQVGEKKGLRQVMAEAAEGKQADQSEVNAIVMQKMIKFLPIMMVVIMVSLPGAIALYYAVSTAVAVFQQHILLQRDEEELTEIAEVAVEQEKKKQAKKRTKQRVDNAKKAEIVAGPVVAATPADATPTTLAKKSQQQKSTKKKKVSQKATVRVVAKPTKKGKKA